MQKLIVIALGGAAGALLRYACTLAGARLSLRGVPLAVLAINVAGCFAAGWLLAYFARRPEAGENLRLFAAVGLLGAFTTFSAFSVENLELLRQGAALRAVMHGALHLVLAVGAAGLGAYLGR